jgi:hypothetical protein
VRITPSLLSSMALPSASVTSTVNGCGSLTEEICSNGRRSGAPADGETTSAPPVTSTSAGPSSRCAPAGERILYWAALTVVAGYPAGVPHSPQNLAPVSSLPQLPQNFLADSAAASAPPQLWQNLPPPLS